MIELPRAEVLRKDLEKDVVGKRIKDVTVKSAALVARHRTRPDFAKALIGRKIESVGRRGVHLVFELDEGYSLVATLTERGTLTRQTASAEHVPPTQLVALFTTGGALHYADPDGEGEFYVLPTEELADVPELGKLGVDPLAETFTWQSFGQELVRRAGPLKTLLMDQTFVIGLGNRYSDETLWTAGLSGSRPADHLSSQEVRRLYRALLEVVHEAVKQLGNDNQPTVTDEDSDEDEAASWINVYGRGGEPCARCRQRVTFGRVVPEHDSYYCPNCQT